MNLLDKLKSMLGSNEMTESEVKQLLDQHQKEMAAQREAARATYEETRDQRVQALMDKALALHQQMVEFKKEAFGQADEMYEQMKEYGHVHVNNKGTFSLVTMLDDKALKITVQNHRTGTFDERADLAAAKVDEYLQKRVNDAALYEFITDLMEKKNGEFDPRNIQKLYQYEDQFNAPIYTEAMKLFRESYTLVESARYIRFYTKKGPEKWDPVNLNFANL